MSTYHCSSNQPDSSIHLNPLIFWFLVLFVVVTLGRFLVLFVVVTLGRFLVRTSSRKPATLYIPPFHAPTCLHITPNFTVTLTTLLRHYGADVRWATRADWVLYDIDAEKMIYSEVAAEWVKPGGRYLVVSRKGIEGAGYAALVDEWTSADAMVGLRDGAQRRRAEGAGDAGGGRWRDIAFYTPTSSVADLAEDVVLRKEDEDCYGTV